MTTSCDVCSSRLPAGPRITSEGIRYSNIEPDHEIIAKGDVEPDHWFRLGRALTPVGRGSALISWSGSMFEYLMPSLVMRAPAGSLLEQTVATGRRPPDPLRERPGRAVGHLRVRVQRPRPDAGVPVLRIRRPRPRVEARARRRPGRRTVRHGTRGDGRSGGRRSQLRNTHGAGCRRRYGFREALDYTPRRLPAGASVAVINSYMAHHQGMALVALGNVVNDGSMVERFHADPVVEATELLLQERMPRNALVSRPARKR